MNARERFRNAMQFKPVDRLPVYEWHSFWDETLVRWKSEGLPGHLCEPDDLARYFGLDVVHQVWVAPRLTMQDQEPYVRDMAGYRARTASLYPDDPWDSVWHITGGKWARVGRATAEGWGREQSEGSSIVMLFLEGPFWFPRTLLGIEGHLTSFYDLPDVLREMNADLARYNIQALDRITEVLVPSVAIIAEDMSYNHGPMLSRKHFDEFMTPYYCAITDKLNWHDVICMVDSDGNVMPCCSWFTDVGVAGFEPLERQAGVDIVAMREHHPQLRMIGGYDKMVMSRGASAMREEFERLMPVMSQGGYIPCVDHQTPPNVSLDNYQVYVSLLKEYCTDAGHLIAGG